MRATATAEPSDNNESVTNESAGNGNGGDGDDTSSDARFLAIIVEAESADQSDIDAARESATDYLETPPTRASSWATTSRCSCRRVRSCWASFRMCCRSPAELHRRHRGYLPARRVDRDREHHARQRHRADPRDRDHESRRRAEPRRARAVPDRIGDSGRDRRDPGDGLGLVGGYLGAQYVDLPLVYPSSTSRSLSPWGYSSGFSRAVSGLAGRADGSDRRAEVRMRS